MEHTQSGLAPVQCIPDEILEEIFAQSARLENDDSHVFSLNKPPWVFSHICVTWRDVALSSPRLWSFVRVETSRLYPRCSLPDVQCLETYLERSRSYPLAIDFKRRERSMSHPLLDALVAHCHRWKDVSMHINTKLFHSLSPIRQRLPLLRSLSLSLVDPLDLHSGMWDIFTAVPYLRKLSIYPYPHPDALSRMPLHQLTSYSGVMSPLDMCKAPNLVDLYLSRPSSIFRTPVCNSDITLRHLRKFRFAYHLTGLDNLCMPEVEELHIIEAKAEALPILNTILLQSRSRLTVLDMHFSPCFSSSGRLLASILYGLPTLITLRIRFRPNYCNQDFMCCLTVVRDKQPCLLPNLETIEFFDVSSAQVYHICLDTIESRWAEATKACFAVARLRQARLTAGGFQLDDCALSRIVALRRQGLSINESVFELY